MAIETILGFRNVDSTENLNARLSGLVPKGIVKGGVVTPEPSSLQVRVKGSASDGVVFLAFGSDGLMVRERAEEKVLPVVAGLTNVIALRCKYLESQPPIARLEVMTLGAYNNDADKSSLIRFASVTPPAGATAVLPEHINTSFRDSIEGFKRGVVRGVVDTKVDLPATSGFPATAEINFISNNFVDGSSITFNTGANSVTFPLVTPISFPLANPALPGLSRINPSQKRIISAIQNNVGVVTVTTDGPHGFALQTVRISDNSAAQANSLWTIEEFTETTFSFQAPLTTPWSGLGGSVVDVFTPATVTATVAPGYTHSFIPGQQFIISGATEQSFNGLFTVQTVVNTQKILFQQIGYPSRDSGNGKLNKVGYALPPNSVEIGESADITAKNFEQAVRSSELDGDLKIFAMGSSLQVEAKVSGSFGNTFTLSKEEPSASIPSIVVSSFKGGLDATATSTKSSETLQKGDIYVVLFGELGTLELWGYDGTLFRNLTSASAATLLDFHRRNFFLNEKHVTETEKAALVGTKGVPGANNRYVTEQDVSVLTETLSAALQGADSVPPGATNRYLTEARVRGQRGSVVVPSGQNFVAIPVGETLVVGTPPQVTFDASNLTLASSLFTSTNHGFLNGVKVTFTTSSSLPAGIDAGVYYYIVEATTNTFKISATPGGPPVIWSSGGSGTISVCDDTYAKKFFNLIYTETLHTTGGCTEYSQADFTPVLVSGVYVDAALTIRLNPFSDCALNGTFPRSDAVVLNKPLQLYVKLSHTPNNGSATLLYSQAVSERNRSPQADMLMGPQRIVPAELQDVVNKTKELRFHAGIATSGSTVSFPSDLFRSQNLQGFKYRRFVGNRPVDLTAGFSINFATGTGTSGIVLPFTPESYAGQGGKWTRYALFLTAKDKIKVLHVSSLLEATSDLSYASILDGVAVPSLAMTDGSHLFATVGVKVNTTANGIEAIEPSQLEFYPYHSGRDAGAAIICGDGTSSFGHFTGETAHLRAFNYANPGDTLVLLPGTYTGNLIIDKDDVTLDCSSGAVLQNPSGTVLSVIADRFEAVSPRFTNCSIAVNLQPGAERFKLYKPSYEDGVITKLKSPPSVTFSASSFTDSVITATAHGLLAGAKVKLTGSLPSGLANGTSYYVAQVTPNTFRLALDRKGATLVSFTNGTGSGIHTVHAGQVHKAQIDDTSKAQWIVTDGASLYETVGDFNGTNAVQQAHNAANEGDVILVYPGSYGSVVWSKSRLVLKGFGGGKVKINGGGSSFTALTVSGSYNQFDEFIIENAGTGVSCVSGAVHNVFGDSVQFDDSVRCRIKFPTTAAAKHFNYHSSVCGRITTGGGFQADNPVVTVGDGVVSWGDYVGENAINVALQEESAGTTIQVFRGNYLALECLGDSRSVIGAPGQQTIIRADALLNKVCVKVLGNKNFFKNLFIAATNNDASAIGLTTVGVEVYGSDNYFENIDFPVTGSDRIESHLKYRVASGYRNRFLPHTGAPTGEISWTVGDGVRSFGDFNGAPGISSAIFALPSHPRSRKGVYDLSGALTEVQTWPGKISGATGASARFTAPKALSFDAANITLGTEATGSTFNITSHGLTVNEPITFSSQGFLPDPLVASPLGATDSVTYYVVDVTQNSFKVSTAANGSPVYLTSTGTDTHTVISGLPFNFSQDDLYRNINISSASSADNIGSFLITEVLDRSSVMLTRLDGLVFTDESNITYDFVSGAKITVMPGVYDPFVIPASKNDVEITAWGSGSDVIIKGLDGETPVSPILTINGNRCTVQGFRFSGGVPETGVAIQVNGTYNTFIGNRFETANRYAFGDRAIGNRVFDSAEAEGRTAYTVSAVPSRADYTGPNEASIQAALDAIARDNHLATVYIGKGVWTFREPVNVPANVQIFGTGYNTIFVGDGTFSAFKLHSDGGQSICGVRVQNFTYSLEGPAQNVYVVDSWQEDAVVDPSVEGEIRFFGSTKLSGNVVIDGSLLVSDYVMVGPGGILDTTGSIGTLYASPGEVNLGTAASNNSLYNFATGNTASGSTKVVNLGTNGMPGSTTSVVIGSTNGGTTTLQNYTVVDDSLSVANTLFVGTSFSVDGALGNTRVGGSLNVSSGNILTTSLSAYIFGEAQTLSLAASCSQSGSYYFATGGTGAGSTKSVEIGTRGAVGSTTSIQLGSTASDGSINLNNFTIVNQKLSVQGDFNVQNSFIVQATTGDTSLSGALSVGTGIIQTSTASADVFGSVSDLKLGSSAAGNTSYSLAAGATASGSTKTVNLGTNGSSGSTTNINLGSAFAGTTRLLNTVSLDKTIAVAGDSSLASGKLTVNAATGNALVTGSLGVISGSLETTATSAFIFATPSYVALGSTPSRSTYNFAFGSTLSGLEKTVNLATGGQAGSTTTVNIGATDGSTNILSSTSISKSLKISGDLNAADKLTLNAATGALTLNGDLTANGNILSSQASLTVFPSVASVNMQSDVSSSIAFNLAAGATASGNTKTLSFGTGGLSGSTTDIVLGSVSSATTVSVLGSLNVSGASALSSDVSVAGILDLARGTITTSQASASIFNNVSEIYLGSNVLTSSRLDLGCSATASGSTKSVNIGVNGLTGSTTNVRIGSLAGGSTVLQNATIVDDTLTVNQDFTVGSNRLVVQASSGNTTLTGNLAVNSGSIITTAASCSIFDSAPSFVLGGTASSNLAYSIASGATVAGATKTVNIATNGAVGSVTNVNIGSANTTAGLTTVNNNLVVRGDLTVQGTTATVNTSTLDVKDSNITVNKGGTDVTAAGAGLTVEGTGAIAVGQILYDGTLASRFKIGSAGAESEVITASNSQTITGAKTFSASQVINTNSSTPALSITQAGVGHALLVEDTSPDSSPFVVDTNGRVGIGTLSTSVAELNLSGRTLIGDQITSTGFSNVVNTSVADGVDAYRTINVLDSSGKMKLATNASTSAAVELQTWNSTATSNTGYWDVYSLSGSFGIRDRNNGLNRIFAHQNGTVLIGGPTTDGASANSYVTSNFGTSYSLVADGNMYISGNLSVSNISNATLDSCSLTNVRRTNLATESATINSTTQILTLTNGLPVQRIQSGTTLAGMTLGTDGRLLLLTNETANDITILHESSVATTATQRFNVADGVRFLLKPKASVLAYYNGALSRWLLLGDNPPPVAIPYKSMSANYTLTPSDYFVTATGAAALTFTLPTAVGVSGTIYYIKNRLNTGLILTVATTLSQTIDDATSRSLARNESLNVISNGSNWIIF